MAPPSLVCMVTMGKYAKSAYGAYNSGYDAYKLCYDTYKRGCNDTLSTINAANTYMSNAPLSNTVNSVNNGNIVDLSLIHI